MNSLHGLLLLLSAIVVALSVGTSGAQDHPLRYGEKVPPEVKIAYERGLTHLAASQQNDGSWSGRQQGVGVTGLCLMAFLANGEDPNF